MVWAAAVAGHAVEWWRALSWPGDVILGGHMSLGYADLLCGAILYTDSPAFIRVQNASGERDDPACSTFPYYALLQGTSYNHLFTVFFPVISSFLLASSLQATQTKNKGTFGIFSLNAILVVFGCPTAHPGYPSSRNYTPWMLFCIFIQII